MAVVEHQILQTIKDAVSGASAPQDFAYSRHEFLFDYELDLRCYLQVPRKDEEAVKKKLNYFKDMKRNATTVSEIRSDLSNEYDPLIDEDFFDHMSKFQRSFSINHKQSLTSKRTRMDSLAAI